MPRIRNEEGLYIGSLFTSEKVCGWPECDSWKTLDLQVVGHKQGEEVGEYVYPFCKEHLWAFVDKYVFNGTGNLILRPDGTVDE